MSSCSVRKSNNGRAKYTSFHSVQLAKHMPSKKQAEKEGVVRKSHVEKPKTTKTRRKKGGDLAGFLFVFSWLLLLFGLISMFVTAVKLGWALWLILVSGILGGAMVLVTLGVLLGLMIMMFGGGHRYKLMDQTYG